MKPISTIFILLAAVFALALPSPSHAAAPAPNVPRIMPGLCGSACPSAPKFTAPSKPPVVRPLTPTAPTIRPGR